MYGSQENILGQKVNVKFFTVDPYPGSPTDFLPIFSRVFFEDVPNQLAYPLCSTVKKSQVIGRKVLERLVKVAIGKMGIGKKWLRSAVERSLGRCHPLNCIHRGECSTLLCSRLPLAEPFPSFTFWLAIL